MKMKCAFELMVIAEAKAEEKAREREEYERKLKEEENTRTLKMCEDIGKHLEEMAENGERPYYCFNCSKNYSLLTKERQCYANGKTSSSAFWHRSDKSGRLYFSFPNFAGRGKEIFYRTDACGTTAKNRHYLVELAGWLAADVRRGSRLLFYKEAGLRVY